MWGPCQDPPPSPGTHQVDDGDGEQAADGQDGQGQPQQGVRLHPLGDGPGRPPGGAAPLWKRRGGSPSAGPGPGAEPAGGRGRPQPRGPQTTEKGGRCAQHRKEGHSRPWGWGQPWQPLGDRSRPGKAEPSGDAGGALSDRPQGLKGRGSDGQSSAGRVPRAGGSHPHSPDPRGAAQRPVGVPPLTRSSSAKHRPRTKPSTQATSPKDTPRAAVLERRGKT